MYIAYTHRSTHVCVLHSTWLHRRHERNRDHCQPNTLQARTITRAGGSRTSSFKRSILNTGNHASCAAARHQSDRENQKIIKNVSQSRVHVQTFLQHMSNTHVAHCESGTTCMRVVDMMCYFDFRSASVHADPAAKMRKIMW
jgi:hypothetical protein